MKTARTFLYLDGPAWIAYSPRGTEVSRGTPDPVVFRRIVPADPSEAAWGRTILRIGDAMRQERPA